MIDVVGKPLSVIVSLLESISAQFTISTTRPTRNLFRLDESIYYVVRQQVDSSGVYHLLVCAKMGKEVF